MASLPNYEGSDREAKEARRDLERVRREEEAALVGDAGKGRLTEARRERVRGRAVAEIPWWYLPWGHLAGTTGVGLVALGVSVYELWRTPIGWAEWLVVPIVFVFANFFEWRVHANVLHKRRWPFEVIYDRHTPMHHIMYVEDDMALRSVKEFRLILIPAAGVLGIVLAAAPFAFAVGQLWSAAAGWLFLVTASLFMVGYEVLHLCYHAPKESFIGRLHLIALLRAHHAKHHDPRLMQKWNFNVTLPLFDWIMRTKR